MKADKYTKRSNGEVPFYQGEVIPPMIKRPPVSEASDIERELVALGLLKR